MHEVSPTTMQQILKSHAEMVFQNPLIDIGELAIGRARPEKGGHRFDDLTELVFTLAQRLLRAHGLFNIQSRPKPQQQGSIARPERLHAGEEPAVVPLNAADAIAVLTALASAQTTRPVFACIIAIVRMQQRERMV